MNPRTALFFCLAVVSAAAAGAQDAPAASQPMAFEDVVRNLQNVDPKVRSSAIKLLEEARYPEAVVPMAALINDPVDQIQLEAIAAELAFFLVEPPSAKRKGVVSVAVEASGFGPSAFELGALAAWPRPAPPELIEALLEATNDAHRQVRVEAIYAVGVLARRPLAEASVQSLIKALEHPDPAVRAGAARVVGRLGAAGASEALFKAINDSRATVRYAAMRALGDLRDLQAVEALTEQFKYYGKGEGAWSALDALARIGHASSVELFKSQLNNKDPWIRRAAVEGLGRAGARSEVDALQLVASADESEMVRAALAFSLQKMGVNYIGRLLDLLDSEETAPQVQEYLVELGAPISSAMRPRLHENEELVRKHIAEVLGLIGTPQDLAALAPLTRDKDKAVAAAATQAIERIKLRS